MISLQSFAGVRQRRVLGRRPLFGSCGSARGISPHLRRPRMCRTPKLTLRINRPTTRRSSSQRRSAPKMCSTFRFRSPPFPVRRSSNPTSRTSRQIGKLASNYQATKSVQSSFMRVNIRGIGAIGNTTIEPSVAIFVDGAYVPRAGAVVSSLLDIESVEVLRGPQGTLFGRNASVGALSLHSAAPRFNEMSGPGDRRSRARATATRSTATSTCRSASRPPCASPVCISGFGGYWHNKLDGKQYGGTDDTVLRGSFHAKAGPIDWVFRADYSKTTGDGITDIELDKNSVSAVQLARLQTLLAGGPDTNFNDRNFNQFVTADLHDSQWGVNSTLSWDVGGGSTVRLIDSYRDWKNTQLDGDVVFSPAPVISRHGNFASKSQNHELQFISPTKAGWAVISTWSPGSTISARSITSAKISTSTRNIATWPSSPVQPFTALKGQCNAFLTGESAATSTMRRPGRLPESRQLRRLRSGQLLSERQALRDARRPLHQGQEGRHLRADGERVHRQGHIPRAGSADFPRPRPKPVHYRLGLNYQATKDHLLYASYSTGYKSGGYNSGGSSHRFFDLRRERQPRFDQACLRTRRRSGLGSWREDQLARPQADAEPEFLQDGHQRLPGPRLRWCQLHRSECRKTASAGLRVRRRRETTAAVCRSSPALHIWTPTSLTIPMRRDFRDVRHRQRPAPLQGSARMQDLRGKPAPNSPKWSGRLGFDWAGDIGSTGWTWDATSNLSFFSKQYEGIITDANPQTIEPSYAVLGARLSISGPGERWTASLFGNNLLNKQYGLANLYQPLDSSMLLRNGVFTGSTAVRRQHADPRTVGGSITFRY